MTSPPATALHFARTARRLGFAARAAGLEVPAFRSPPRRPGATRSIRRLRGGTIVSIRLQGRSTSDVELDMVDGIVAANGLTGEAARRARNTLVATLAGGAAAAA